MRMSKAREAMTLVEVIVATVLFAMVAGATITIVLQSRKMAENNIYRLTAYSIAHGYLEQIISMDFATMQDAFDNNVPLPFLAMSPTVDNGNAVTEVLNDPISLDTKVEKNIVVDIRGDPGKERLVTMPMELTISMNDLNTGANPLLAYEIALEFAYKKPLDRAGEMQTGRLMTVKSPVQNF